MIATNIKRVVSTFLLSGDNKVAVFHRVASMPTFPSSWAACSGSIEPGETPWEAARRELYEETNLPPDTVEPNHPGGLYLDVPGTAATTKQSKHGNCESIIRVYPFTVNVPPNWELQLKGTEHDTFKLVTFSELEKLEPTVPGLVRAFHHATFGRYCTSNPEARAWARDMTNGAAVMTQNALELVYNNLAAADVLKIMRPSMVSIVNALNCVNRESPQDIMVSMQREKNRTVQYAVDALERIIAGINASSPLTIATHSRSSTVVAVLKTLMASKTWAMRNVKIVCGKSTPGDEGILMARDLGLAECDVIDDSEFLQMIEVGSINILLTGCDCITQEDVFNKVGTLELVHAAQKSKTQVFCCVDRGKEWLDIFPPPLEDIFEGIPKTLFDSVLMPPVDHHRG
jgi:translation initiation factor 2B subunit (eIF-2B alpha/beta/delta family)/8-oxo-dGTP pyrophosphatase MutT (NUDIX family)